MVSGQKMNIVGGSSNCSLSDEKGSSMICAVLEVESDGGVSSLIKTWDCGKGCVFYTSTTVTGSSDATVRVCETVKVCAGHNINKSNSSDGGNRGRAGGNSNDCNKTGGEFDSDSASNKNGARSSSSPSCPSRR